MRPDPYEHRPLAEAAIAEVAGTAIPVGFDTRAGRSTSLLAVHRPAGRSRDIGFPLVALSLAIVLAVHIYAGFALRGLYADGAEYLIRILVHHSFAVVEPSRAAAQIINQTPSVIAVHLPGMTLDWISDIFSISLNIIPILLTFLSYFCLPPDRKILFLFPVFTLFAGTLSASFASIADAATTSALFWVVLYLTLFIPDRLLHRLSLAVLALPTVALHEAMVFLGPILAMAAFWRCARAFRRWPRIYFGLLGGWFLIAAAVEIHFLAHPRDPSNRSAFMAELIHLQWLLIPSIGCNVPALLGVLAGLAILVASFLRRWATATAVGFGIVAIALAGATPFSDWFVAPSLQFFARNTPVLLAAPLALVAFLALAWPASIRRWASPQSVAIIATLAVASSFWQGVATWEWARYIHSFRTILNSRTGLIGRDELMARLPPGQVHLFARMANAWTSPDMSLLLSADGQVRSVLENPDWSHWQPFDPAVAAQLPKSGFFNTAVYKRALAGPGAGHPRGTLWPGAVGFSAGAAGGAMLGAGWATPEGWGTWSDADRAELHMVRAGSASGPITMTFHLVGFAPRPGAYQYVHVLQGGRVLADWRLPDRRPVSRSLALPAAGGSDRLDLTFVIAHPTRPTDRGGPADGRRLGVGIISLDTVTQAPVPDTPRSGRSRP